MFPLFTRDYEPVTSSLWRPLLRQLDEMFDQQAAQTRDQSDVGRSDYAPSYEVDETESHYVMSFDVPGVHRDDLTIEVTGNRLLVRGERKGDGRNGGRRFGKFQHVFTLPDGVTAEGMVAEQKDGVLRLAIQKPTATRATRITIADGAVQSRDGGFFKSLVGNKKKETVDVKSATAKNDPVAMAN